MIINTRLKNYSGVQFFHIVYFKEGGGWGQAYTTKYYERGEQILSNIFFFGY